MLVATTPGASFALPFTGTAAGIAVVAGPDAGIIEYSIDGGAVTAKDLFTENSSGLHLPLYLLLGDGLTHGPHVLKITVAASHNPQSTGTACRVVHFLVNEKR